jgi:hypothetical protein
MRSTRAVDARPVRMPAKSRSMASMARCILGSIAISASCVIRSLS